MVKDQLYQIDLPGKSKPQLPAFTGEFGRVTVILGANGTGKSRLIRRLASGEGQFGADRPLVYIEGGRVIVPPKQVGLDRRNIDQFRNLEEANIRHRGSKKGKLADRISEALVLLERRGEYAKLEHSDACLAWDVGGQVGNPPRREMPPLEQLFGLFQKIFPEIWISINEKSQHISCEKNGSIYFPEELSDGERQVLAILADLVLLGEDDSVVLVDEPELNLHPHLASRLWDQIEISLPDATFVYGTHSLAFAMRPSIARLIVLSGKGRVPITVPNIAAIPGEDLRHFLGAIPSIVAAAAALVVEGEDSSFDSLFYRWLIKGSEAVIVPVGSCHNVSAAAKRVGVWEAIAPIVSLTGVIDHDYRTESVIDCFSGDNIIALDLHEAESYVCFPEVITSLASALGLVSTPPTEKDVTEEIIKYVESRKIAIVAKRIFSRLEIRFRVSIPRTALEAINDIDTLINRINEAAKGEEDKVKKLLSEPSITKLIKQEISRIEKAITNKDIETLLVLAPGKELLTYLMRLVGCSSPIALMGAIAKHFEVEKFSHISDLSTSVLSNLNLDDSPS